MSLFLALGLSVEQVIERTTLNPARALRREHELGSLGPGGVADVAVLALEKGEDTFVDATGEQLVGRHRFVPHLVLCAGEAVPSSA